MIKRFFAALAQRPTRVLFVTALYIIAISVFSEELKVTLQDTSTLHALWGYAFTFSFLVTAALAWEFLLLGQPNKPHEWPAQFALFLFVAVFTVRLCAQPTFILPEYAPSSLGTFGDYSAHLIKEMIKLLPEWLYSFFANWRIDVLILAFTLVMCFRTRRAQLFLLGGTFVLTTAFVFITDGSWFFAIGCICGSLAFCLQLESVLTRRVIEETVQTLEEQGKLDANVLHPTLRLMWLLRDGAAKPRTQALLFFSKDETEAKASLDYLIQLDLIQTFKSASVDSVQLSQRLCHGSALAFLARFPRAIILLGVAIVWAVLPIDLIPDAIPFFGTLDDIAIVALALSTLRSAK